CSFFLPLHPDPLYLHSFPTRRSSDLPRTRGSCQLSMRTLARGGRPPLYRALLDPNDKRSLDASEHQVQVCAFRTTHEMLLVSPRSEEHTSELQSLAYLVCRLLLEKKK